MRIAAYQPDIALNVGALIRLSACFAAPLDVIEPCGFPFSLKAVRRAAMDYADLADINRWDSWEIWRRDAPPGRTILLTTRAETPVWDFAFHPDDRLLFGRESAGVPASVHDAADASVVIPMPGGGRSLNIAVAAGIALSAATRSLRSQELAVHEPRGDRA